MSEQNGMGEVMEEEIISITDEELQAVLEASKVMLSQLGYWNSNLALAIALESAIAKLQQCL